MAKQIHHITTSFCTTIYYGNKEVARCCLRWQRWHVALSAPSGRKYFIRDSLSSVKEAVRFYMEG